MKRMPGISGLVLLLLVPIGLAGTSVHALDVAFPGVDVQTPTQADQGLVFNASAQSQTRVQSSDLILGEPVVAPMGPGEARMAGKAAPISSMRPIAAAATGAALGLGLLAFLLMPFFSRIDSNRILDNEQRQRVHEAIEHNPGITIKEIVQNLQIGWGTAVYHLKRLEEERIIVSERHRQFRRYYKNGGGIANESKGAFAELKNPTTQRLAAELLQRPGRAQKELCEAAGISAPLAHKYLGRMESAQLLTRQREWKTVKYFPTPRLAELMGGQPQAILLTA